MWPAKLVRLGALIETNTCCQCSTSVCLVFFIWTSHLKNWWKYFCYNGKIQAVEPLSLKLIFFWLNLRCIVLHSRLEIILTSVHISDLFGNDRIILIFSVPYRMLLFKPFSPAHHLLYLPFWIISHHVSIFFSNKFKLLFLF